MACGREPGSPVLPILTLDWNLFLRFGPPEKMQGIVFQTDKQPLLIWAECSLVDGSIHFLAGPQARRSDRAAQDVGHLAGRVPRQRLRRLGRVKG